MLTRREEEIVEYIAWGASAKETADYLNLSTVTVQNHIHNIKKKLRIQKSTEICVYYFCKYFNISKNLSPIKNKSI